MRLLNVVLGISAIISAPTVSAQTVPSDQAQLLAEASCANGNWQSDGWDSYETCYYTYLAYYTGGGGGVGEGGGGGGGGGGTNPGTIPNQPNPEDECDRASRLCSPGIDP